MGLHACVRTRPTDHIFQNRLCYIPPRAREAPTTSGPPLKACEVTLTHTHVSDGRLKFALCSDVIGEQVWKLHCSSSGSVVTPTQREVCEWTVTGDCVTCSKEMVFLKAVSPDFSLCECVSVNRKVWVEKHMFYWVNITNRCLGSISPHNQKKKQKQMMFC